MTIIVKNWLRDVKVTDWECTEFLNGIRENPHSGAAVVKLVLCSDFYREASGILTDVDFETIVTLCPNIRHLELYRCLSLTEEGLKKICGLARLKLLSLSCCPNTTDQVLESLKGKPLQKLDVENCKKITSVGFAVIPTFEKFLRQLKLRDCTNLTDDDLENFTKLNLNALDILGCEKVTDKGLDSILKMKYLNILNGMSSEKFLPLTSLQKRDQLRALFKDKPF